MSLHDEGTPAFRAPPLSCDCHFHVFGPADRYPYGTDLRYPPPLAPLEDYLALCGLLGIERYVFVQPSAYGRDNTCMLDAMREVGAKCRGIVDIEENAPDAELARLHAAGVLRRAYQRFARKATHAWVFSNDAATHRSTARALH